MVSVWGPYRASRWRLISPQHTVPLHLHPLSEAWGAAELCLIGPRREGLRMVISLGFPGPAARSIVPALNGHRAHHSTQAVWVHVHVDAFVLPCPDLHTQERTRLIHSSRVRRQNECAAVPVPVTYYPLVPAKRSDEPSSKSAKSWAH